MATPKQVSYALSLLDKAGYSTHRMDASFKRLGARMSERSGTVAAWLGAMSSAEASALIDRLEGETGAFISYPSFRRGI